MRATTALALLCMLATKASQAAENWRQGSVTFYGNAMAPFYDPYPLMEGTCSCKKAHDYGICYNGICFEKIADPKMVAAITRPGMENTRLCGQCFEIRCTAGKYRGLDWSEFGSPNVCRAPQGSIVVQITDSCPTRHPNESNSKYCVYQPPVTHFDLSYWAFERLADPKYGVVDVQYRSVQCPTDDQGAFGTR
jgi:hypothetical protein